MTILGHLAASFTGCLIQDGASHVKVLVLSDIERQDSESLLNDSELYSVDVLPTDNAFENIVWINPIFDDEYAFVLFDLLRSDVSLCEFRILGESVDSIIQDKLHTLGFNPAIQENGFLVYYREPPRKRMRRSALAPGSSEYADAVMVSISGMSLSSPPIIEEPPDSD